MNPNPLTLPIVIVLVATLIVVLSISRLRILQRATHAKWRRITERVLLSLVILICATAAGSTIFNAIALRYYRATYSPLGKIYRVNGHDMHIYCTGEGSPTIVLDAGMGNDSLAWAKVQPELSKTTRVCSYDRAGMGWSTPGPDPRDADTIASELHALLQQAGVSGPIVLMGHSMGGIFIRAYATHYPQDVVGLIFIESASPFQEDHESAELRAQTLPSASQYYSYVALIALGIPRLTGDCSADDRFDGQFARMKGQLDCGMLLGEVWREYTADRRSGEETINTGPYGDMPVLIFSRDPQLDKQAPNLSPKLALEMSVVWNQTQEDLKRLSTRSRRVIGKGSGHHLPIDRADLIDKEIPVFIQQIRNNEMRTDYGTTKTE
ncbi:MAG: alpha/beta hydrolase [Candidatus Korobacteraceae bacterium]